LSILESGIFIPGNGKALAMFTNSSGKMLIAASENRGPIRVYAGRTAHKLAPVSPGEKFALVKLRNGATRKQELYYGASFLSQSGRSLVLNQSIAEAEIVDGNNQVRKLGN
jgi:hypothetical protein